MIVKTFRFIAVVVLLINIGTKLAFAQSKDYIQYNLGNSKGVVVAKLGHKVDKSLMLYDNDGQIWKILAFGGPFAKNMKEIAPYAMHMDTYLLAFKCLQLDSVHYSVVVDEKSNKVKNIKVNDKSFKFLSWQNYILNCFSVGFEPLHNGLHEQPAASSKSLTYSKNEFYFPVKFKGDWLQVKWGDDKRPSFGWIKWKINTKMIIELFNDA